MRWLKFLIFGISILLAFFFQELPTTYAQDAPVSFTIPIGGENTDITHTPSAPPFTPTLAPTTPAPERTAAPADPSPSPTRTPIVIPPPISDQYIYLMITLSALAVLVVFFGLLITRSYRR